MDPAQLANTIHSLLSFSEAEWIEFKQNNIDPQEIGEYISALSNSAALLGKQRSYLLWGVQDGSRKLVGTSFEPKKHKIGNQELESWLVNQLDPQVEVLIHEHAIEGKSIVLFEISPAINRPVRFRGTEYIRIGSYKKKLSDYPEKERRLWRSFDKTPFEEGLAATNVTGVEVCTLLDYPLYFDLIQQPSVIDQSLILGRLESEKLIRKTETGTYDITNLGAILFARNLRDFGRLGRKSLRVIFYKGDDRTATIKEHEHCQGYARGLAASVAHINDQLPQREAIVSAHRTVIRAYPEIAVREFIANALIHQDFTATGAGPMVEIFQTRIEISNPGAPLVDTLRFIDVPPNSRNEVLASFMRRLNLCEERGTGIDKALLAIELSQSPPPNFRAVELSTITTLYGPRTFLQMDNNERLRACYQHACLRHVKGLKMTNGSLRERLGIQFNSYTAASRLIRDAIKASLIKPYGEEATSGRGATYVPFWAK